MFRSQETEAEALCINAMLQNFFPHLSCLERFSKTIVQKVQLHGGTVPRNRAGFAARDQPWGPSQVDGAGSGTSVRKPTVFQGLHSLGGGGLQSCPNSARRYSASGGRGPAAVGPQPKSSATRSTANTVGVALRSGCSSGKGSRR